MVVYFALMWRPRVEAMEGGHGYRANHAGGEVIEIVLSADLKMAELA